MRSGRLSNPLVPSNLEAELRSDGNLVADRCEGLAYQFLVDIRTVDFRRVEERDAPLVGLANLTDALVPVNARPVVAAAERHVAEANLRHLQASQFPCFHSVCTVGRHGSSAINAKHQAGGAALIGSAATRPAPVSFKKLRRSTSRPTGDSAMCRVRVLLFMSNLRNPSSGT